MKSTFFGFEFEQTILLLSCIKDASVRGAKNKSENDGIVETKLTYDRIRIAAGKVQVFMGEKNTKTKKKRISYQPYPLPVPGT